MSSLLREMYEHQAWADAEHWRAIGSHAPARDDLVIRARLYHIHLVQRLFLWAVGNRRTEPTLTRVEDFKTFEELKTFARLVLDDTQRFMTGVDEARLSEAITIPWAATDGAPLTITVAQALTQAAMHSHYHRGQNASRLRELGGVPPTTDLIVWYWNGRKKPEWEN